MLHWSTHATLKEIFGQLSPVSGCETNTEETDLLRALLPSLRGAYISPPGLEPEVSASEIEEVNFPRNNINGHWNSDPGSICSNVEQERVARCCQRSLG